MLLLVLEQDWLMKYGYLPPPDPSTGQLQAWTAVTHALKAMQRFAGLHDTGVLGRNTYCTFLFHFTLQPLSSDQSLLLLVLLICLVFFPHSDEETLRMMQTPRCSLPDDEGGPNPESDADTELQVQRVKRAISSWAQRNINWRFVQRNKDQFPGGHLGSKTAFTLEYQTLSTRGG